MACPWPVGHGCYSLGWNAGRGDPGCVRQKPPKPSQGRNLLECRIHDPTRHGMDTAKAGENHVFARYIIDVVFYQGYHATKPF